HPKGRRRIMRTIASLLATLHSNLDQVLNLEAGLADAHLLHDLHTTLIRNLNSTLKLDAGLAQILPPPSTPATAPAHARTGLDRYAYYLSRRHLRVRLLIRTRFPFQEISYLRSIAELIDKKARMIPLPVSEVERACEQAEALSKS